MPVYRILTEKKSKFATQSENVLSDLKFNLQVNSVENVRLINIYDVEGISKEDFEKAIPVVFSESSTDNVYKELPDFKNQRVFTVELLPGQFDQRADSAAQGIAVLLGTVGIEKPIVKYAKLYVLEGKISDAEFIKIKNYLINPVESREISYQKRKTLKTEYEIPAEVEILDGFIDYSRDELGEFLKKNSLAMDLDDIEFCRDYFKKEKRNPTITEIRMIDTYWSDHCRHTTFGTLIDEVQIDADYIEKTYKEYLAHKTELGRGDKPVTLMDIATMGMRKLKTDGFLPDLDESEEINACSIKIDVDIIEKPGKPEKWLLMFKNETHNHPTEIEPFGGAATCLGGAIRDVLSGRALTHQAMRITGCSNPLVPVSETIPGKLPPRKITVTAAEGYSSYGNQVGVPSGHLTEIYHDGYMAKRMELGAVIGAAPAENVIRKTPKDGDLVILLGGRTGRDGCGGATGSSKSHDVESLEKGGAEVQKGNAPEERKIQRLFRNPEAAKLIKRCNDFGAGGVSVAIGELADGLFIDLNKVTVKYPGLDGTELAISESQERMAVVVNQKDAEKFISLAEGESLEAVAVAEVKAEKRLKMSWNGKLIVDLSREFLNSNGADKHTRVKVVKPDISIAGINNAPNKENWKTLITDINICSRRALSQRFDSTVGAWTVLMPFGGKTMQTPAQVMAAKIPVVNAQAKTASLMAWGYNPVLSKQSPYHGAAYAVVESISKIVAAGGKSNKVRLSFQEYFERLKDCPERWGKPFAALLGAYGAQIALKTPSIGGKDSMSGTFEDIDVPPTLVSFAVATENADNIISPEFKHTDSKIMYIAPDYDADNMPDYESADKVFKTIEREIGNKNASAVWALTSGGIAEGVFKMCLGNRIGAVLDNSGNEKLFAPCYGGFIVEAREEFEGAKRIGKTIPEYVIRCGYSEKLQIDMSEYEKLWEGVLEPIFPSKTSEEPVPQTISNTVKNKTVCSPANKTKKPLVLLPVFPGTSGEYEMQYAFEKAGAETEIFVIKDLTPAAVRESVREFSKLIQKSNMIALSGGLSAGGEPDGSGKLIAAFFRNEAMIEAVQNLLKTRDGLIFGAGDGFNALMRLGLLPYGEIKPQNQDSPALVINKIGRHQSQIVYTRICSVKSPWLTLCNVGEIYAAPISCGEGRFTADEKTLSELIKNAQIFTQYVNLDGEPTSDSAFNPVGSLCAAEGMISPDGRVIGKMGHIERMFADPNCAKNVPGNKDMPLFKAGVEYFL